MFEQDKENIYNKKFSVAMSVYKNDNSIHFKRALDSITELQSIVPNEIVLVVDGPVGDALNEVIENVSEKYDIFNIIRLPENKGLGNALNVAVKNAKYEYIARMDSDDVCEKNRFEQQLSFFSKHPEVDIVGGNISEFIETEDNIVGHRVVPKDNLSIVEYMKSRCAMNHVTVMYKKDVVEKAGGYLDLFWNEDYYLWIRMWLNNAVFANTGTNLVNVRVGEEMYQRRGGTAYFKSEKFLQDFMLRNHMITRFNYIKNIILRFIMQIVLPNKIRGWAFRTFAREKKDE